MEIHGCAPGELQRLRRLPLGVSLSQPDHGQRQTYCQHVDGQRTAVESHVLCSCTTGEGSMDGFQVVKFVVGPTGAPSWIVEGSCADRVMVIGVEPFRHLRVGGQAARVAI